ncbi:MAG TPA: hypothetical protein VMT19_10355 [Thermoanaerobaculaceae bacterium]|nr:hypothetical protein [Thermoanaerobaculaceae bacterium]
MATEPPTTATGREVSYTARIWTWRLFGVRRPALDVAFSLTALAALVASRFALLPSGPWEWDETLFARGLLRFDLPAHFPHPPGFPLWMALGWLLLPLVPTPLAGLQLLSAAASCLSVFPLAALGRRAAPAPVAAAAAFAVLFVPGVWVHAGRGFSDTAAALLALWAAALAAWRLEGRRATAFTLLVTAAFLVRPVLLPPFGLLWIAGALTVRPRRKLVPGILLAVGATAAAAVGLVAVQGSWRQVATAFSRHAATHARNLVEHNPGGVFDLGIVKGFGGPWSTAAVGALALLGMIVWARTVSRRSAAAWLAILAVTVAQLVWLQNRRFPRYAVPLQEASAPLIAAAASALAPPAVAAGALAALGVSWLAPACRPVVEQHRTHLPGWDAVQAAVRVSRQTGDALVVEPGLYPFLSYQEELDRVHGTPWTFRWFLAPASPDSKGLPAGPYVLATEYPFHYFASLSGREERFAGVSDELRPLTQGRFLNALEASDVPLPLRGWWLPEVVPGTAEKFMWGGREAEVLVPPLPAGDGLAVDVLPYGGPTPLEILVDGAAALTVPGDAPRGLHAIHATFFQPGKSSRLLFRRAEAYSPGGGDTRKLSVQLWGMKLVKP